MRASWVRTSTAFPAMSDTDLPLFWQQAARRTARKVNFGWWLERFAPALVIVGVLAFGTLLFLRSREVVLDARWVAGTLGGAVAVAAVVSWLLVRGKFIGEGAAMVTLEARLHLNNALTTAREGRAPWPPEAALVDDGLRWSWQWFGTPVLAAAACVATALLLPIRPAEANALPPEPPLAWPEMQSWIEQLQATQTVDEKQLEELQEKLDALRNQPEREWYAHKSLEATDSMHDSLKNSLEQMGNQLDAAQKSFNALQKHSDELSADTKDKLAAEFQAALAGLQANELKLDPELMKKLSQIDPKSLKSLTKEQAEQLKEAMKKCEGACKSCAGGGKEGGKPGFLGDGEGQDDAEMAELMKLLEGQGEGEGDKPGRGGVSRGPGAAPLFLGENESRLGTNNQEAARNPDLSRATPADLIGLGDKKHEVDTSAVGPQAGGEGSGGAGGEQVWKESLSPAERAVLKRYFSEKADK